MNDEFADWHPAHITCPACKMRSTWCAAAADGPLLEYMCLACNGRFYRRGQSFIDYTPWGQLSGWDQERIQRVRVKAGCGNNSAVGAFG